MKDQMVFARSEMKYLISKRDHDRLKELMKEYMIGFKKVQQADMKNPFVWFPRMSSFSPPP